MGSCGKPVWARRWLSPFSTDVKNDGSCASTLTHMYSRRGQWHLYLYLYLVYCCKEDTHTQHWVLSSWCSAFNPFRGEAYLNKMWLAGNSVYVGHDVKWASGRTGKMFRSGQTCCCSILSLTWMTLWTKVWRVKVGKQAKMTLRSNAWRVKVGKQAKMTVRSNAWSVKVGKQPKMSLRSNTWRVKVGKQAKMSLRSNAWSVKVGKQAKMSLRSDVWRVKVESRLTCH
jgi:hypothetical protein